MPTVEVKVAWRHDSGLPEDAAVNTWHFLCATTDAGLLEDLQADLASFYTATYGGEQVNSYFSSVLTGIADVKMYDLSDPTPRTPIHVGTIGASGATSGTALPSEVAVRMSVRRNPSSGDNAARMRGGPFIGPLGQAAQASTTNPRPASALQEVIVDAAEALAAANTVSRIWVIYSPTDAEVYEINHVHVDNAFDTIRSRGERATSRNERDI